MHSLLHGLEPANVLAFFEDITKIPHASGKESALADYVIEFAKKNALFYHRDQNNNVLVRKKASPSYESHRRGRGVRCGKLCGSCSSVY